MIKWNTDNDNCKIFASSGSSVEFEKNTRKIERIKEIEAENEQLKIINFTYKYALQKLLLSADCTWEDGNQGHDWKETVEEVRKLFDIK